jgi:glycosyltransferase involved in cell wall biosynthesis
MKKVAIVYLAHDGFTSLYTGVGTVARDFLLSFPSVYRDLKKDYKNVELTFFATTLKYNNKCFGYSEDIREKTLEYTKKYKYIHLIELINGSAGTKSYGSINMWKYACISAVTFLYTLVSSNRFSKIIVICVDTPFAQVPNYFFDHYNFKKIKFVWLPQSTVLIHKIDSALGRSYKRRKYIQDRFSWEKAVIDLAQTNKQLRIGCVGEFMKNHLIHVYKARKETLINLQNSLFFKRLKKNFISQRKIGRILAKLGVPTNRSILFSFGRAEPYKGLDLVLKYSPELIKEKNYFVLILASPYSMNDPYVTTLDLLAQKYPKDIKIVYSLDFLTPHYIMQWHNTKILALFSRAEPFGLIPTEARFYKNKNLTIITSDVDGYREQINDGVDGFLTKLNYHSSNSKLQRIANLNKKKKENMAVLAYNHVLKMYDQINVNKAFIRKLI